MRSLEDLLPRLLNATNDQKLKWEVNSPVGFVCKLGNQYIKTWSWHDDDTDTSGVTVQLLNSNGFGSSVLDSIAASDFDSNYNEISKLNAAARRSALNVDHIIGELSEVLDHL